MLGNYPREKVTDVCGCGWWGGALRKKRWNVRTYRRAGRKSLLEEGKGTKAQVPP